ncbi:Glycosyltransferase involved in cell wall bisynthesis (RfaB) [Fructobacillus tropaeoli]|uniref:glycosyltransferase n=1 Tax=Fructobacillus tropaeoli TaxID=709323 RepID=UPI002D92B9C6|nr:Glycosyltransferase involved in cell wall bisynthesis (RfaB) [Fructobacillus tropaeoli]
MFYFLTHSIDSKLAGLEIAMINRLKVFNFLNEDAKIVTFRYNRFQHRNIKPYDIDSEHFLNLFDYYQKTVAYSGENSLTNSLDNIVDGFVEQFGTIKKQQMGDEIKLFHQNSLIAKVTFFSGNQNFISNVQIFDNQGNIMRDDGYDSRGFLSITSYFGQDGGVSSEDIYNAKGEVVIQFFYHELPNSNIEQTAIILNDNDARYVFHSLDELTAFFYDEIAQNDKRSIFIADRSYLVDPPLLKMKNKVPVFEYWHNTYSSTNSYDGEFSEVMNRELSEMSNLSGYILPTIDGSKSLKQRLPSHLPVFNATVALTNPKILPIQNKYNPHKIIMVARIDKQKNIGDALRAFSLIRKRQIQAELFIYGYIYDQKYNQELLQLIQSLDIEKSVHFEFYRSSQDTIYKDAAVMIMTSENEGWGMSINEALAVGIPVISYDTCFGPSEIITNGEDGIIVPKGDYRELAKQTIRILDDSELRQKLSKNAKHNMQRYDINSVSHIWKDVINKMKQTIGEEKEKEKEKEKENEKNNNKI